VARATVLRYHALAGSWSINPEPLRSRQVDGAGAWARFRHITLPLLRRSWRGDPLLDVLPSRFFNIVYVLTRGGPSTQRTSSPLAYQVGLQAGKIGEGSAIALFMFPYSGIVYLQLHYASGRSDGHAPPIPASHLPWPMPVFSTPLLRAVPFYFMLIPSLKGDAELYDLKANPS